MTFGELARKRYSVRRFSGEAVSEEDLRRVLAAASAAPTACNLQPQRIYVMRSAGALERIRKCTPCHFDAPVVLVFAYDRDLCWRRSCDQALSGPVDAAIVMTHAVLQAAELGLGSTWVGCFDPGRVSAELRLPENIVPVGLLPLGHPAADAAPAEAHFQRRPEEQTVVWR